jgi:hypothetical protein
MNKTPQPVNNDASTINKRPEPILFNNTIMPPLILRLVYHAQCPLKIRETRRRVKRDFPHGADPAPAYDG